MKFNLPWPVSLNRYYRCLPRRGVVISAAGRKYNNHVNVAMQVLYIKNPEWKKKLEGRLHVNVLMNPPTKRACDLDNYCKSLLDSMEKAEVFVNDNQIDQLVIERGEIVKFGLVQVEIIELKGMATRLIEWVRKLFAEDGNDTGKDS